jgi:5-methylcytosine-specific restriction enzyme B
MRQASAMDTVTDPVRAAAGRIASRCFRRGASLFTPRLRLWTAPGLADLATRLERAAARADAPGGTAAPFEERWHRTLARADGDTVALAAEVLYVHLLFPASVGGSRKRALLEATLARLAAPPRLPRALDAALDHGIAPVGVAYTRNRLTQLGWLAAAAGRWHRLPATRRRAALADPHRTAEALSAAPGGEPQRAALLHLLHPDAFAPVTSVPVRRAILRAFAAHVPETEGDPDCALAAVRAALEPVHGQGFSFFDPEVAARWQ